MNTVTIKAKKDLYNSGKCFTKGHTYTAQTDKIVVNTYSLMDITFTNDLGEPHRIGDFHKDFKILS